MSSNISKYKNKINFILEHLSNNEYFTDIDYVFKLHKNINNVNLSHLNNDYFKKELKEFLFQKRFYFLKHNTINITISECGNQIEILSFFDCEDLTNGLIFETVEGNFDKITQSMLFQILFIFTVYQYKNYKYTKEFIISTIKENCN